MSILVKERQRLVALTPELDHRREVSNRRGAAIEPGFEVVNPLQ
jgi:hypothetical protein